MGLACFSEVGMIMFRHSYQPALEGDGVGECLEAAEASDPSPHQMFCCWGGGDWRENSIWGIGNCWCAKYLRIIFYSECERVLISKGWAQVTLSVY